MNEEIFRQKSLEKIRSPEELNDYVRVANPGVWLLLLAIVALLAGACVWGAFGTIETTFETEATAADGVVVCALRSPASEDARVGMTVRINGTQSQIVSMETENGVVCRAVTDAVLADGVYEAEIVLESIHPMSLLFD